MLETGGREQGERAVRQDTAPTVMHIEATEDLLPPPHLLDMFPIFFLMSITERMIHLGENVNSHMQSMYNSNFLYIFSIYTLTAPRPFPLNALNMQKLWGFGTPTVPF